MVAQIPTAWITERLVGRTRWVLPQRDLGDVRHLGWVLVGMGLFGSLFLLGWMATPFLEGIRNLQQGNAFGFFLLAFAATGLLGFIPCLGMLLAGFAVVANRTSTVIEVDDEGIRVTDRLPFGWLRRKRPRGKIARLRLSTWKRDSDGAPDSLPVLELGTMLQAEIHGAPERFPIAVAYPQPMLESLAGELASHLGVSSTVLETEPVSRGEEEIPAKSPLPLEIVRDEEPDSRQMPPPPVETQVAIVRREDGITIEVPPVGFQRGSQGLLVFAILWNGFMTLFTGLVVAAMCGAIQQDGDAPGWLFLLFLIPFWAIGIGLALAAINSAVSHATLATADRLLMVVNHSLFGKTVREWSADDLLKIECGRSGVEVNDKPVMELRIVPVNGTPFGALRQLTEPELAWIAAELRQALSFLSTPQEVAAKLQRVVERNESGLVHPSPSSRIVAERRGDQLRLVVPPRGWRPYWGTLVFGSGCLAATVLVPYWFVNPRRLDEGEMILVALGVLVGSIIGIGAMVGASIAARRRFDLIASRDELVLVRQGPFATREFRWRREELKSIQVGHAGAETNQTPAFQVRIVSTSNPTLGIMTTHDRSDLAFVAVALAEHFGLDGS